MREQEAKRKKGGKGEGERDLVDQSQHADDCIFLGAEYGNYEHVVDLFIHEHRCIHMHIYVAVCVNTYVRAYIRTHLQKTLAKHNLPHCRKKILQGGENS